MSGKSGEKMELVLIFLEKILEAIYFSAFLLIGKNIKNKRILFTGIMIFEYLILTTVMEFNIWIQIIYTFMTFVNLKVIYKEKAQVTDIFLFMISSIILILISFICGLFQIFLGAPYVILLIFNRIVLFLTLFGLKNKINETYKRYCLYWNKHNKSHKIKSLTLRNISIIVFNLMFFIINIGLIYAILTSK